ncbi:protein SSXA1-like, partial [Mastomys coucha]|uniref:protein SSXA1-like n=1 Tax=Mastomys coucha TaxID=35658 RepID=UPI00126182E8
MNRRSHSVNLRKTKHKPEEICKAFKDISKYFSKAEWAKLSHSEKITYVYMKRNYTTMTNLGLRAHLPDFMESKEKVTKSVLSDSGEVSNHESQGLKSKSVSIWRHRLRERKKPVIYEEEEGDEDKEEEE